MVRFFIKSMLSQECQSYMMYLMYVSNASHDYQSTKEAVLLTSRTGQLTISIMCVGCFTQGSALESHVIGLIALVLEPSSSACGSGATLATPTVPNVHMQALSLNDPSTPLSSPLANAVDAQDEQVPSTSMIGKGISGRSRVQEIGDEIMRKQLVMQALHEKRWTAHRQPRIMWSRLSQRLIIQNHDPTITTEYVEAVKESIHRGPFPLELGLHAHAPVYACVYGKYNYNSPTSNPLAHVVNVIQNFLQRNPSLLKYDFDHAQYLIIKADGVVAHEVERVHTEIKFFLGRYQSDLYDFMQSTGVRIGQATPVILQPHSIRFIMHGMACKGCKSYLPSSLFTFIIPLWDKPNPPLFSLMVGRHGTEGVILPMLQAVVFSHLCLCHVLRNREDSMDAKVRNTMLQARGTLVFEFGRA
jgi:hypothetical protein